MVEVLEPHPSVYSQMHKAIVVTWWGAIGRVGFWDYSIHTDRDEALRQAEKKLKSLRKPKKFDGAYYTEVTHEDMIENFRGKPEYKGSEQMPMPVLYMLANTEYNSQDRSILALLPVSQMGIYSTLVKQSWEEYETLLEEQPYELKSLYLEWDDSFHSPPWNLCAALHYNKHTGGTEFAEIITPGLRKYKSGGLPPGQVITAPVQPQRGFDPNVWKADSQGIEIRSGALRGRYMLYLPGKYVKVAIGQPPAIVTWDSLNQALLSISQYYNGIILTEDSKKVLREVEEVNNVS
jgi:hypothetical protein